MWELKGDIVFYKSFECKMVFEYGYGNLEILCFDDVLLVKEEEIDWLLNNELCITGPIFDD